MICAHCNKEIRDGLVFCPVCGNRVEQKTGKKKRAAKEPSAKDRNARSWWLFGAIIVLAAAAFAGYSIFSNYYINKMRTSGEKAYKRNDYAACVKSMKYVVRKNPRAIRERMELAECYLGAGENRHAVAQMKDAVSWAPEDTAANAGLAKMFFLVKKYKEAEKQALKTLRLDSGSQQAKQYLGMSQLELGEFKKAEKSLLAARAGAAAEDAILVNNALGETRINLEDLKGAIKAYEASIELYANQLDVLINLAILHQKVEDFEKCLSCAKRAFTIAKQTGDAAGKKKARALADGCGAVVSLTGIKDCVSKRRGLDREYVAIFSDLKLLMDEINAEPADYIGKPNAELSYMKQQLSALMAKYRSTTCPADADNYFRLSVTTFTAQLETFSQAVTSLKDYIETKNRAQLEKFQQLQKLLDRNNDEIINIWKTEEEKFDVPPIFTVEDKPLAEDEPQ